jgi:hypothetical protein
MEKIMIYILSDNHRESSLNVMRNPFLTGLTKLTASSDAVGLLRHHVALSDEGMNQELGTMERLTA